MNALENSNNNSIGAMSFSSNTIDTVGAFDVSDNVNKHMTFNQDVLLLGGEFFNSVDNDVIMSLFTFSGFTLNNRIETVIPNSLAVLSIKLIKGGANNDEFVILYKTKPNNLNIVDVILAKYSYSLVTDSFSLLTSTIVGNGDVFSVFGNIADNVGPNYIFLSYSDNQIHVHSTNTLALLGSTPAHQTGTKAPIAMAGNDDKLLISFTGNFNTTPEVRAFLYDGTNITFVDSIVETVPGGSSFVFMNNHFIGGADNRILHAYSFDGVTLTLIDSIATQVSIPKTPPFINNTIINGNGFEVIEFDGVSFTLSNPTINNTYSSSGLDSSSVGSVAVSLNINT